jgi:hypothetical protein
MKRIWILGLALALMLTAVGAPVSGKHYSGWYPGERLPEISSAYMDSCPAFTKDGLSLYFVSYDPGVLPSTKRDLYVSQRASLDAAWGPPTKLGDNINTDENEERCPYVTPDGRRLLFVRQTAAGDDFYMSTRRDKKDDFAWGDPVKIGALGSTGMETAGWGFEDEDGDLTFYFGSSRSGQMDIYQSTMDSDGSWTEPFNVSELNDLGTNALDYFPVVRKDGLEMYIISNRSGSIGGSQDIWVSTRNSTSEKWSTPTNVGLAAINSAANEWRSALTWDGMNMVFASNITGNYDLYKSQRIKVTGAKK